MIIYLISVPDDLQMSILDELVKVLDQFHNYVFRIPDIHESRPGLWVLPGFRFDDASVRQFDLISDLGFGIAHHHLYNLEDPFPGIGEPCPQWPARTDDLHYFSLMDIERNLTSTSKTSTGQPLAWIAWLISSLAVSRLTPLISIPPL